MDKELKIEIESYPQDEETEFYVTRVDMDEWGNEGSDAPWVFVKKDDREVNGQKIITGLPYWYWNDEPKLSDISIDISTPDEILWISEDLAERLGEEA